MNINWNFISELEGKGVKKAYVPSDNSGVTVATGFVHKIFFFFL